MYVGIYYGLLSWNLYLQQCDQLFVWIDGCNSDYEDCLKQSKILQFRTFLSWAKYFVIHWFFYRVEEMKKTVHVFFLEKSK